MREKTIVHEAIESATYAGTTIETAIRMQSKLRQKRVVGHCTNSGEISITDLAMLRK